MRQFVVALVLAAMAATDAPPASKHQLLRRELDGRLELRVVVPRRLAPTAASITTAGARALAMPWVARIAFFGQA